MNENLSLKFKLSVTCVSHVVLFNFPKILLELHEFPIIDKISKK